MSDRVERSLKILDHKFGLSPDRMVVEFLSSPTEVLQ